MKFSVVIPVYNVAPYLGNCLDSLVASSVLSGESAELLCVDDGSTDGSSEILESYARDPSLNRGVAVRVLHQSNAGVSAARNRGLPEARGEWLLFVDSDDVVRESLFADLLEAMKASPEIDLIGFGMMPFLHPAKSPDWDAHGNGGVRRFDLLGEVPDSFATLSAYRFAYRRSAFGGLRFPSYGLGEDLVFVSRVLARATSCLYLERIEYGYRGRPGSAVAGGASARSLREAVLFNRDVFQTLSRARKRYDSPMWRTRIDEWILRLPLFIFRQRRTTAGWEAWSVWLEAMKDARSLSGVSFCDRLVIWIALKSRSVVLTSVGARLALRMRKIGRRLSSRRSSENVLLTRTTYDAVFSLGQWCATAIYLRKLGLRTFSGPLDWLGPYAELPVYVDTICADFSCFMEKENLRLIGSDPAEGTEHYEDSVTTWLTCHEFKIGVDFETNYRNYKKLLNRRVDRFQQLLREGARVLFVQLHGEGCYAPEVLKAQMRRLREHYPNSKIDILVVEQANHQTDIRYDRVDDGILRVVCDYYDRSRFDAVMGREKTVVKILGQIRMRGRLRNLLHQRLESLKRRLSRRGHRKAEEVR